MRVKSNLHETIVVHLSNLSVMLNKLGSVTKTISEEAGCDVIVDFSDLDMITTPAIIRLIILRKLLAKRWRQHVLHSAVQQIRCVSATIGRFGELLARTEPTSVYHQS